MIIIFLLSNYTYARYNYNIILDAFSLNRDNSEIVYEIEKGVQDDVYTNKDVILKIIANKEIEEIQGFSRDQTRTILTKTITENKEESIVLEDLSGNKKEITYKIENIDKEPPQILGIEDGEIYTKEMSLDYSDNIGISDIKIDRYHTNFRVRAFTDYYDTSFYEGLDVLGNTVYLDVINHPKGTKKYKFYLNNTLKTITEKSEYTYTGLTFGTNYDLRVEAIDENDNILKSVTEKVKTKHFKNLVAERSGDNFKVKITGIDDNVKIKYVCLWNQNSDTNRKKYYPTINSDRSIELSFNAYDVDGTKCKGYYYYHIELYDKATGTLKETICMNVIFGDTYQKFDDDNIAPYNLSRSGNYEIIVTDLAGNKTKKYCTINL